MKIIYSKNYEVDIGPHVFPTDKYRQARDLLLGDGTAVESDFMEPRPASRRDLETVHTRGMLDDLESRRWTETTRHSELPLTSEIVNAYVLAAGGTALAARMALEGGQKIVPHLGGGFHHAFANRAEGFCYINDIAVAIRVMQRDRLIRRAMVVDADLHQGNGTAHIFADDPDVFTMSIHQEHNYPVKQRSDLDIGLDDFAGDETYLRELGAAYPAIADRHKPELLVYVAGADPYEHDQLGAIKLTMEGLRKRDELVLGAARSRGISTVVVMAGGYAADKSDTARIHAQTVRVAKTAGA
jgi:acetoin utilization deacetylase AcuC-like enzyme